MFVKLFSKEWKEKISLFIFPFIGMLIFVVAYLSYPSEKFEVMEYLTGVMLMIFLPFTALLLGASGFQSEFKDGAWAYLFSKPIKKWKIWAIKYFSQITILLSILMIFRLIIFILAGLKEVIKPNIFSTDPAGISDTFSTCILLSLCAFTISFSISFLHDKQFIILFGSILIGSGLTFASYRYFYFLEDFRPYESGIGGFYIFVALSFILASILTFIKSDFSQTWKRIWLFSKFVLLFLVISLSIKTVWTLKDSYDYIDSLQQYDGNYYFQTNKGIYRYLLKVDKLERIIKYKSDNEFQSIRGGKVAFFKYRGRNIESEELWIINTDGSQKKRLFPVDNEKVSFYFVSPRSKCILSQDGKKVAFITYKIDEETNELLYSLWWMNTDGTGLKSKDMEFLSVYDFRLIAWPEFGNSLIILLRDSDFSEDLHRYSKILKFNFETKTYQILAENLELALAVRIPSKHDLVAFCSHSDKEGKQILSVLDLRTLERKEVYKADSIDGIEWSKNGTKLAFLAERTNLMVYNLLEDRMKKILELNHLGYRMQGPWFDFVLNDQKIVTSDKINSEFYLRIHGEDFSEKIKLKIPFFDELYMPSVCGLNNIVLVHNIEKDELWKVNLDTEEWRKIYH